MLEILRNKTFLALIFGLFVFNITLLNDSLPLVDEDEGAYAGFAQNMLDSGDLVNPTHEWSWEHRKTPFHFWMVAASMQVFGRTEFAVRIPVMLAILLTIMVLYELGKRRMGDDMALASCIVLCSSIFVPLLGKVSFTDAWVLLFGTTAFMALWNQLFEPNWKWTALLWVSISLGMLAKGPVVPAAVGVAWLVVFVFDKDKRKALIATHPWLWGLLALLPVVVWGWLSAQRDGGQMMAFLWDWYILRRTSGGTVFGQSAPPGYHLLIIVVSFLPWLPLLPSSLGALFSDLKKKTPSGIFLIGWMAGSWFLWELPPSKLPTYAIMVQPLIAILIARQALSLDEKSYPWKTWDRASAAIYAFVAFVVAVGILAAGYTLFQRAGMDAAIAPALAFWVASFVAVIGIYLDGKKTLAVGAMTLTGMALLFLTFLSLGPKIIKSDIFSMPKVANAVFELCGKNPSRKPIVYLMDMKNQKPSLAFYLDRAFDKVDYLRVPEKLYDVKFERNTVLLFDTKASTDLAWFFTEKNLKPVYTDTIFTLNTDNRLSKQGYVLYKF